MVARDTFDSIKIKLFLNVYKQKKGEQIPLYLYKKILYYNLLILTAKPDFKLAALLA
jgi:hypothetical protein